MKMIAGLLLLAHGLLSRDASRCHPAERFWTAENVLIGGQTLESILGQQPVGGNARFAMYDASYNNSPASFKYTAASSTAELAGARNEVAALRQLSGLHRSSHLLACVEGEGYVGVFLAAQGADLYSYLFALPQQPQLLARLDMLLKAGQAVAELHAAGFAHGNLRLENFSFKAAPSQAIVLANFEAAVALAGRAELIEGREVQVEPAVPAAEAVAKDVRDFALVALSMMNYEFANSYYTSADAEQADLTQLLNSSLDGCDASIRDSLLGWIGAGAETGPLGFSQVIADIEKAVKEVLLEQKAGQFGVPPLTRDMLVDFVKQKRAKVTKKVGEAAKKGKEALGEVAEKGEEALGEVEEKGEEIAHKGGKMVHEAAKKGEEIAHKGGKAVRQAAKRGVETAKDVAENIGEIAEKGFEVAKKGAKTVGKIAEKDLAAAKKAVHENIEKPIRGGRVRRFFSSLKERIWSKFRRTPKAHDVKKGAQCWITHKLSYFNNAMTSFKKKIVRAIHSFGRSSEGERDESPSTLRVRVDAISPRGKSAEVISVEAPLAAQPGEPVTAEEALIEEQEQAAPAVMAARLLEARGTGLKAAALPKKDALPLKATDASTRRALGAFRRKMRSLLAG